MPKSTFWTKNCLLIQCVLLLDGVWISFYRNEKKINAFFCIKVHFSIINLCKQSPMGNKNESFIILLRKRKRGKNPFFFLQKQALRPCQCQSLNGKKKSWKDLSSGFRYNAKILTQHFESHTGLYRPGEVVVTGQASEFA